jgi:hypothetical protein
LCVSQAGNFSRRKNFYKNFGPNHPNRVILPGPSAETALTVPFSKVATDACPPTDFANRIRLHGKNFCKSIKIFIL